MDEQQGQEQGHKDTEAKNPMTPPLPTAEDKENRPETKDLHKNEPPHVSEGSMKRQWISFVNAGFDCHLELFLAFSITFFADAQWITSCQNDKSTSTQTDKLIISAKINARAAQKIAEASQRNATAAESFAISSGKINGGIGNAVTQLGDQVEASRTAERAFVVSGSQGNGSLEGYTTRNTSKFSMHFYYINVGRSPAISVKVEGVIDLSGREDSAFLKIPTYDGLTGDALSIEKEKSKVLYEREDGPKVAWGNYRPYALSHPGYSVYGYIQYKDIFEVKHITAFCNYYPFIPTQTNGPRECLKGNWIDHPPKNPKSKDQQ